MNLNQRIEWLEKRYHPGLAAALTSWYEPLDSNHPALQMSTNDKGQALISLYWSVWFLAGTEAEQKRELELYRANSRYKQPPRETPNLDEVYVEYVNGGCLDTIFCKLSEEEAERTGTRP
jgi:hypothetical protein